MLTREKMRVCSGMMTPLAPIRSANEDNPRQDHTQEEDVSMTGAIKKPFNTATFLATKGPGRSISTHAPKQVFFSQGGPADAVFHLQTGRAKLTVRSKAGKEATVTLLAAGDFFGEEAMAEAGTLRTVTASAITACTVLRIATAAILRVLQTEHKFSIFFLKFIVIRGMRTQADLIDQLFNSSERRLARTLLLMAEYGEPGAPETLIPPVSQETLADMIGTTRSRVSFFMNRFRKLGYIKYNGGIRVHKSLLKVFLQDQLPEENSSRPKLLDPPPSRARTAKRAKLV
jgi:CRP/FNR family transcriptional regulator, cyclic AMP receptor protein